MGAWGGRESGARAKGEFGRNLNGGWGGREAPAFWGGNGALGERETGANGSMGRKGGLVSGPATSGVGSEPGAEGSMRRTRNGGLVAREFATGGREARAEGRLGRKEATTLTLKLRHFAARQKASTLLRSSMEGWVQCTLAHLIEPHRHCVIRDCRN